jgi:predicted O-methyltransferase YrrM
MALIYSPQPIPASEFARVFEDERVNEYPAIDALEQRYGYALDRAKLEEAGRILCSPVKASPPNWQHGRVLYAVARDYFSTHDGPFTCMDIGTAKGFSALCVLWALTDSGQQGQLTSVDVMPPEAKVRRGTISEVPNLLTLREILAPWPESQAITFLESTGIDWLLTSTSPCIHFAFVDGKHAEDVVYQEGKLLAKRQQCGDVVIFDDVQMPQVKAAVDRLAKFYRLEMVTAKPGRAYAIGVRLP